MERDRAVTGLRAKQGDSLLAVLYTRWLNFVSVDDGTNRPLILAPDELKGLLDVATAANDAVILTYDPSKTTAQNDEYQRRAANLYNALAALGLGPVKP